MYRQDAVGVGDSVDLRGNVQDGIDDAGIGAFADQKALGFLASSQAVTPSISPIAMEPTHPVPEGPR